jgi:hypothetical protein
MAINIVHKPLNMALQAGKIGHDYPLSSVSYTHTHLLWTATIIPSPLSLSYDIRLSYTKGKHPNVYVVSPKLELHPDAVKLPHVYDTEQQWLCLYHRPTSEWENFMYISDTIIPWTYEWLIHYELWLSSGEWHGGGTVHPPSTLKNVT